MLHASLYPKKVISTIHQKDRLEVGGKRLEKDAEDYYKRDICHICMFSFVPTKWILLFPPPADCRGRLQTIRQFRRSDFRRSTQACFPLFIHSGINYPPAAGWSPFLSREGNVLHASLYPQKGSINYPPKGQIRGKRLEKDAEDYYKRDICHIRMFSFVLTKLNQKERRVYDMSFFLVTRLLNSRICLFRTDSKRSLLPLSSLRRRKLAACSTVVQL